MRAYWNRIGWRRASSTRWWRSRYSWLSLVVATLGLIVSTSAWFAISKQENQLAEFELASRAEGQALNLQVGIAAYLRKVFALRAMFETFEDKVSRAQFEQFTRQLMNDQTAILGMSWIPRVTADQRVAHERAAVLDGLAGYRIRSVAPDGSMVPSPEQEEYFPVFYNVTEGSRSSAYGLELSDGSMRQQTLERARDSNAISTSPIFTLQTGAGYRRGFIVALPVFAQGSQRDTIAERHHNLRGYVTAVFQASVLIDTIVRGTRRAGLDLYFYPADAGVDTSELIYFHGSRSRAVATAPLHRAALRTGAHWIGKLDVGESRWTMIAVPIPGGPGIAVHTGAWLALILGLLVSGITAAYTWSVGRHGQRLQVANSQLDQTLGTLNTVNGELSAALKNMAQGFIMFDSQDRIAVYNERYLEMYGMTREIVKPGMSFLELLRHRVAIGNLKADPKQFHDELLAELAKGEVVNLIVDCGDGREISVTQKPIPGGGWVATHEDITERRQAEARISHMALHDGLTDLANRHLFNQEIAGCFKHLPRGQAFALLCLDLDRFKNVNDTLGHPLGDKLLQQVAARLRLCVREYDTVARLGGDEFAILQRGVAQPVDARALSERVVATLGRPFDLDGHQVAIGVSIGVALAPADATDGIELLKAADLALLRAKAAGRGTYRFFDAVVDGRIQTRHAMEQDLRQALLNDEFVMEYQPLVNLQSGKISALEALIRWNHPKRGTLLPVDFIPFAEETAQILPIGEWALRLACKDAATWPGAIGVTVNLSPLQFRERDLCETVIDALARSGLAADRLELEITETALLRNQESTLASVRRLRALGVRIAMDDFGTGHSSLRTLRNFPFDRIKIDECFVNDLLSKPDSRAIIQAVAQMASDLGLKTTAEGVETQGELDYLRRVGCTEAQGYLFSKAVPAREVYALLGQQEMQATAPAAGTNVRRASAA
jgi:diguanylate cyclase (GGDEF)-like protein/PAS domain S-box-containing protein